MATSAWRWYLTAVVLVGQFYFVSSIGSTPSGTLYTVLGLSAVAAMVAGIALHRPPHAAAWAIVAVGLGLFLAGDYVYADLAAGQSFVPFPSTADWLYLGMYPLIAAALIVIGRKLSPDHSGRDAVAGIVVAVGTAAVLYVLYMGDYLGDPFFDTRMRVVAVAYPLLDATIFGVAAWLILVGRSRSTSLFTLGLAVEALVIGNAVYNVQSIDGSFAAGGTADLLWIGFTTLLGIACLHPSMKSTEQPEPPVEPARHTTSEPDSVLDAVQRRALLDLPSMPDFEIVSHESISSSATASADASADASVAAASRS